MRELSERGWEELREAESAREAERGCERLRRSEMRREAESEAKTG